MNSAANPWAEIRIPSRGDTVSMRRVSESLPHDFYWGRDDEGRSLLVLRHAPEAATRGRLPHLRGVEIFEHHTAGDSKSELVIRLLDSTLQDIFLSLCNDIVVNAGSAAVEAEAVARAVARTWRWHYLLRGGSGLLTVEEQKGLIGELLVLEQYLIPVLGGLAAVDAWQGPLGATQDFAAGCVLIESKARSSTMAGVVSISSEQQLDPGPDGVLFLHLTILDGPGRNDGESFSLTDIARRVRAKVAESEHGVERLDALFAAAGFDFDDDYERFPWVGGGRAVYRIRDGFPRLVPGTLPGGLHDVRYHVELGACAEFLVQPLTLLEALGEVGNV